MSILLYGITRKSGLPKLGAGVAGLSVLSLECGELAALFSAGASAEAWTGAPIKESARQFHQVLRRVFEAGGVIPFRFPTLMRDAEELSAYLRDNAPEYVAQLKKFGNSVQMDITVTYSDPARATSQTSGAEYLRGRQEKSDDVDRITKQLQIHASSETIDWRSRPAQRGLKVFALLDRNSVAVFNKSLQAFAVPAGLSIRISGPWPVTEFLELSRDV